MALIHVEVWARDDQANEPIRVVVEHVIGPNPVSNPYGALSEIEATLRTVRDGVQTQARRLANELRAQPQEVPE